MKACTRSIIVNETRTGGVALRIGAHLAWADTNDPFGRHLRDAKYLTTVLVEPHPTTFALLAELVRKEGKEHVIAEHAAACNRDGTGNATFYTTTTVRNAQYSSLSKQHVLQHLRDRWGRLPANVDSLIAPLQVPCYSVGTLLRRHGLDETQLRVLTVDAEGHDLDILEGMRFGEGHALPLILVFEQIHLLDRQHRPLARLSAFVGTLVRTHRYACHARPAKTSGVSAGLSPDMWCVHHAAKALKGCEPSWNRLKPEGCGKGCGWR